MNKLYILLINYSYRSVEVKILTPESQKLKQIHPKMKTKMISQNEEKNTTYTTYVKQDTRNS